MPISTQTFIQQNYEAIKAIFDKNKVESAYFVFERVNIYVYLAFDKSVQGEEDPYRLIREALAEICEASDVANTIHLCSLTLFDQPIPIPEERIEFTKLKGNTPLSQEEKEVQHPTAARNPRFEGGVCQESCRLHF